ncbi:MAG: proton-conducting transporter membrane subunit, partial [Phycisphaerae bacterium]
KMGIFGLLRLLPLFPARPLGWGLLVMALGATSAFLGVLWAIGQHDLKKLLAYHSVENIGIILLGLGLALIGETYHQPIWIVLGIGGCLLHVWNHGLFKSLLFLSAGSVIHSARTRDIDALGGLAKSMPITAGLFLIGAVAICGLPPLNGFVSEWFIYMGLLHTIPVLTILGFAAVILTMVGALAAACFTKAYGTVFLGTARSAAHHGHEAGPAMWLPMLMLAGGCIAIGIGPEFVAPLLDHVIHDWTHQPLPTLASLVPLPALTLINVGLIAAMAVGFVLQKFLRL